MQQIARESYTLSIYSRSRRTPHIAPSVDACLQASNALITLFAVGVLHSLRATSTFRRRGGACCRLALKWLGLSVILASVDVTLFAVDGSLNSEATASKLLALGVARGPPVGIMQYLENSGLRT